MQASLVSQPNSIQPHLQTIGTPYIVSNQGCCCGINRSLPDKVRVHTHRLGVCMLAVGLISSILGVVGFFILGHYSTDTSHHPYPTYVAACGIGLFVFIAPNIWCGLFVSIS